MKLPYADMLFIQYNTNGAVLFVALAAPRRQTSTAANKKILMNIQDRRFPKDLQCAHTLRFLNAKPHLLRILLMTQIPPSLLQPSHQQLPALLCPYSAQKTMSPLPHKMAWVISIAGTATNLGGSQSWVKRDLGGEIKSASRRNDGR